MAGAIDEQYNQSSSGSAGRRLLSGRRHLHTLRWWRLLLGGHASPGGSRQGGNPAQSSSAASQPAVQAFDGSPGQPAAQQRIVAVRPPAPSTNAVIAAALRNLDGAAGVEPLPTKAAASNGGSQQANGGAAGAANGAGAAQAGAPAAAAGAGPAAPAAPAVAAAAAPVAEGGQSPHSGACPPPA